MIHSGGDLPCRPVCLGAHRCPVLGHQQTQPIMRQACCERPGLLRFAQQPDPATSARAVSLYVSVSGEVGMPGHGSGQRSPVHEAAAVEGSRPNRPWRTPGIVGWAGGPDSTSNTRCNARYRPGGQVTQGAPRGPDQPQALQADQTCGELHRTGLAPRPTRPRSPGAQPGPRAPLRLSGRRTTMPLSLSENSRERMETSEPVGAAPGSRVGASPRTRSVPNRPLGRTTAVLTQPPGRSGS